MELDAARRVAEAWIGRAPGAARNNPQLWEVRVAQVAGVLHDLVPGGDTWRLMSRFDPPPGADQATLDWLAVLGDAWYSVSMVEGEGDTGALQVLVRRIPFDLIEVVSVTDARVDDHGAVRLQRSWRFRIGSRVGATVIALDEDRILRQRLDSEDRFIHELARRAGWPVNTELVES